MNIKAKTLWSRVLFLVLVTVIATGCFKNGAPTPRPDLNLSPWTEREARSERTGSIYSYMHLPGPTEEAPVILLLHGGIFDNRIWLYTSGLGEHFQVYAPQYPDNSLLYSGKVTDWGKVVTDFVNAAGIKPDYIAAVSNGAYGAIEYMDQNRGNQVKGLALISTLMFSVSEEEVKKRTRMANLALRFSPAKLQGIVKSRSAKSDYGTPKGAINQHDIFFVRPYPYYFQVFSVPAHQGDRVQNTKNIKIPVLVLHGTEDDIMPIHAAKLTPGVFPNATFQEFEGLGHDMVFSNGDQVAQAIIEKFTQ